MQIWLILAVVGSTPIHVGNFPDMGTCEAAAMSSRGQVTGGRPGSMSYLVDVRAGEHRQAQRSAAAVTAAIARIRAGCSC